MRNGALRRAWGAPGAGRTLDSVIKLNNAPTDAEKWLSRKMLGVGAMTGPESGGLLVIDFDGTGSQSVRAFKAHFRHYPSELPPTICNTSGKLGRCKVFLRVGPEWFEQLKDRNAKWLVDGQMVLEAIWMNSKGSSQQAVICGDHPQKTEQKPTIL